jgi:hypothetical protein
VYFRPDHKLHYRTDERGNRIMDFSYASYRAGIAFSNRRTAGPGHGWDIGWAVAWNVASPHLLVQQPPGAMNWRIGCSGERTKAGDIPEGIYDSPGRSVEPVSLYLEQLRERPGGCGSGPDWI